ncbi:hypothetical protein TBLA_0F03450 [Henningerozyma blattae CBS 6284]|uniref:Putative lipoate-protein ligase A n=1 Tax=Henningerozyma blattae (strain ATCC 34711 / CBS 6284 / DSM 70876 / NBRC 10599 / NRRL Y-10934 / UCD 77-7) TaxID=1071380 RepID=I2H680_HENB6|nr:hypothetical protein TBLA_0F03450 [Tetrapisispora blattae CBS 6284]CCH61882.1 hypothetical protein TBLA_0F03450 [Tetrapisispora blattae CBS 6284]
MNVFFRIGDKFSDKLYCPRLIHFTYIHTYIYIYINIVLQALTLQTVSSLIKKEKSGPSIMLKNYIAKQVTSDELRTLITCSGRFVLHSVSKDPYDNLALEDYLFRHTPLPESTSATSVKNNRLFLYINNPCCVIGRNQLLWREVNVSRAIAQGIPLVRRLSGGGAVVHDWGNINYAHVTTRDGFTRTEFTTKLVRWLVERDPTTLYSRLQATDRGDITLDGTHKLGGSAFKIGARGRAYHHGTLLVDSQLDQIKGLLQSSQGIPGVTWTGSGVDSVRAHVTNLPGSHSVTSIWETITMGFQRDFAGSANNHVPPNSSSHISQHVPVYSCNASKLQIAEVQETAQKLRSADWVHGGGPPFSVHFGPPQTMPERNVAVRHGIICATDIVGLALGTPFAEFCRTSRAVHGLGVDSL